MKTAFAGDPISQPECAPQQTPPTNLSFFLSYKSQWNETCKLSVGAAVTIDKSDAASPTGVEQRYRLRRISEKDYIVDLRVRFQGSDLIAQKIMRDNAAKCLAEAAPFLKGPNGESLRIQYSEDASLPENIINIEKAGIRDDSHHYGGDTECSRVLHETLHLLGLVDEYVETEKGFYVNPETGKPFNDGNKAAYDCRAIGPKDSIMAYHDLAYSQILPRYKAKYHTCQCTGNLLACETIINKANWVRQKGCPSNFTAATREEIINYPELPWTHAISTEWDFKEFASLQLPQYEKLPPLKNTLLYPAQFRMITAPDCMLINSTYSSCAAHAYETSLEHHGGGCTEDKPDECKKQGDTWLK